MDNKIDSFSGKYRFLSNFYPVVVEYDGQLYKSVEHAYQAAKTLNLGYRDEIRRAPTAGDAKRLSKVARPVRSDWLEVRVWIMKALLKQKLSQPDLAAQLLSTGDAKLVEGNTWNDTFWGVCNGVGDNMLGHLLMDARDGLAITQSGTVVDVEASLGNPTALHGYMTTYSGIKFYPMHPNPEDVSIYDIAHALSHFCRWGGHCSHFYSVAQHSVMVSEICDPEDAFNGLMHDSAEAYLGDMIRPLKYLPEMAIYKKIEHGVTASIAKAFGVESLEKTPSVEVADAIMLAKEFINLRRKDTIPDCAYATLTKYNVPHDEGWSFWEPDLAKKRFLNRFDYLIGKRQNGKEKG
jgi:ribA/ribD-fused uncharacterized protein